jgi:imidazolonepropionase-like amidohydrolase
VEAGVNTLEHGTYLYQDPAVIRQMVARGVFLVPTLKVGWDIILAENSNIPDWIMQKNKDSQGDAERSLKLAYEARVNIAMGSDVGTPLNYHGENALEVYWMHKVGLSAMDALVAATGNAAKALGWDAWLGTLEPGKVADLIVHAKNPLEDLRALADKKSLRFVMKAGVIVAYNVLCKDELPGELFAKQALTI